MDAWVLWVIAGIVLAVGEVSTMGFFLAPFAAGALAAAVIAAAGAGLVASWIVFVVLSMLLLTVVRPIARAHLRTPAALRTGTAALVGSDALVVAAIEGPENMGRVKIGGEVWSARAYEGEDIPEGTHVQVVEIRGATALVTP
jgi:membrane protein implicated in regulation of membrane protease activity